MVISTPFLSRPSCAEAVAGEPMRSFCGSNVAAAPIAEAFRNSLLLFISCASCSIANCSNATGSVDPKLEQVQTCVWGPGRPPTAPGLHTQFRLYSNSPNWGLLSQSHY